VPKGPQGERRPADAIGRAVMVARIATGEFEEAPPKPSVKRKSGLAGAKARATLLSPNRRNEIASAAAKARWS